ncbi:MAG: hypothetical protein IKC58_00250 [Clostridia bacterium]|nr:hypothetical protein [Clostridia bacterium]
MAIGEHKEQSPYHGVFVASFFMILVPVLLYLLINGAINLWKPSTPIEERIATAKTIGCGAGFLFHVTLIIVGVLKDPFNAVVNRICNFFDNLKFNFKLAWSCYCEEVRETGIAFWILIVIMIVNFVVFWSGAKVFILDFFG